MNIFFLSLHPRRAAEWHCNRHVVKMILESTQMLWTAQHVIWGNRLDMRDAPRSRSGQQGYRPVSRNHPCAKWVRTSLSNYRWLCALASALIAEYHYRYPEAGAHACEDHVAWLSAHPPPIPELYLTEPPQAMPDEYKADNVVTAYRQYYLGQKRDRGLLVYTRRPPPEWVISPSPPPPRIPLPIVPLHTFEKEDDRLK